MMKLPFLLEKTHEKKKGFLEHFYTYPSIYIYIYEKMFGICEFKYFISHIPNFIQIRANKHKSSRMKCLLFLF